MKLEHIALTIREENEISMFYKQLLGMQEVRSFVLDENLSAKIFGIPHGTRVYLLSKGDIMLEIFVNPKQLDVAFNHVCLMINDRQSLINKAIANNYECIQIARDKSDLVFIKDKSGNIFEIKNND